MDWRPFLQVCPLEKNYKFTSIIDDVYCSGQPLILSLLYKLLKEDSCTVCFLSLARPLAEIIKTSRRLGLDLNLLSIQNRFWAIETLGPVPPASRFISLDLTEPSSPEEILYNYINKIPNESNLVIVIDSLEILKSIGWPLTRIIKFIKLLETLQSNPSLLFRTTIDDGEGEIFSRWLIHRSQSVFLVRPLSSGANRDVHGEICIKQFHFPDRVMLFKTTATTLMVRSKFIESPLQLETE